MTINVGSTFGVGDITTLVHCGLKSVSSETTRTGDHLNTIFSADLHGSRNIRARYESMHMCVCMYLLNW